MHPFNLQSRIPAFPSTAFCSTAGHAHHPVPLYWLPTLSLILVIQCLAFWLSIFIMPRGCSSILSTLPTSVTAPTHPPSPSSTLPRCIQSPTRAQHCITQQLSPSVLVRSDSFGKHILEMHQGFSTSAPLVGLDNAVGEDASSVHCRI